MKNTFKKEKLVVFIAYLAQGGLTISEISEITGGEYSFIKRVRLGQGKFICETLKKHGIDYPIDLPTHPTEFALRYLISQLHDEVKQEVNPHDFQITSPEGKKYIIRNMTQFASEHGLHAPNIHKLIKKEIKQTGGWTDAFFLHK